MQGAQSSRCASVHTDFIHTFEIPTVFSRQTMQAIKTGKLVKNARVEIVAALYSRMIQQIPAPTPYEYRVACQRLIPNFTRQNGNWNSKYTIYYNTKTDYC